MALARMTTWTYRSRTHQGLGSEEQIVTNLKLSILAPILVRDKLLLGLGQTPDTPRLSPGIGGDGDPQPPLQPC